MRRVTDVLAGRRRRRAPGRGRARGVRRERLQGRLEDQEARGVHHDHHDGAAGRAAHRPARSHRRGPGPAGGLDQDRQRLARRPAPDRHRPGRHRLGRGRRGSGHPLPRDVPVAGARRRRPGAFGASHRPAHRLAGRRGVRVLGRREVRDRRHRPGAGRADRRERGRRARCSATPHAARRTTCTPSRAQLFTKGGTPVPPPPLFDYAAAPVTAGTPASAVHIAFANREFAPTYTWEAPSGHLEPLHQRGQRSS